MNSYTGYLVGAYVTVLGSLIILLWRRLHHLNKLKRSLLDHQQAK